MSDYVSYGTHGVDATEFYKEFDATIAGVSRATGTCRESVSKIPIDGASHQTTEKIIIYLEEISVDDYDYAIQQCKQDIVTAFKTLEEAWQNYNKKEKLLDHYRSKYHISRKREVAEKASLWKVLRCLKSL